MLVRLPAFMALSVVMTLSGITLAGDTIVSEIREFNEAVTAYYDAKGGAKEPARQRMIRLKSSLTERAREDAELASAVVDEYLDCLSTTNGSQISYVSSKRADLLADISLMAAPALACQHLTKVALDPNEDAQIRGQALTKLGRLSWPDSLLEHRVSVFDSILSDTDKVLRAIAATVVLGEDDLFAALDERCRQHLVEVALDDSMAFSLGDEVRDRLLEEGVLDKDTYGAWLLKNVRDETKVLSQRENYRNRLLEVVELSKDQLQEIDGELALARSTYVRQLRSYVEDDGNHLVNRKRFLDILKRMGEVSEDEFMRLRALLEETEKK